MTQHWIRFDKQLPPEDTTVMVSNGPAIGNYHFKTELYEDTNHQYSTVILWTLDGVRVECAVKDIVQWLMVDLGPQPQGKNQRRKVREISLYERIKLWFISKLSQLF